MEKLDRSKFTVAGEIANERLLEAATDPDLYPQGSAFIAADQEHFGAVVAEAVANHRPLVIVYPDGHELVAAPRSGALAFIGHLLERRRPLGEQQPSVPLPVDYQVEIREQRLAVG